MPRRLLLGVQGVNPDERPRHRYPLQQLAHGGDFIGFGLDQLAAAIILTYWVGERDDLGALCVTQLLAICGEQLPRRRRAAHLSLPVQQRGFHPERSTACNTRPKVALLGEG